MITVEILGGPRDGEEIQIDPHLHQMTLAMVPTATYISHSEEAVNLTMATRTCEIIDLYYMDSTVKVVSIQVYLSASEHLETLFAPEARSHIPRDRCKGEPFSYHTVKLLDDGNVEMTIYGGFTWKAVKW